MWRTFMLYTKQNELIVSTGKFSIRHHATYFWQIDDEASKRRGVARVSSINGVRERWRNTLAMGCLGWERWTLTLSWLLPSARNPPWLQVNVQRVQELYDGTRFGPVCPSSSALAAGTYLW